ncbi:MAG: hypothetical protein ACTHMY_09710 [Solirubrobacteraceae bacterium]
MLDVRDRSSILAALRDAGRRFEKGAPPPLVVRDLLHELADALADSGPFELDVQSGAWLGAVAAANRGVASLGELSPSRASRQTGRSIRELQWFFARKQGWGSRIAAWGCAGYLVAVFLVGIPIAIIEKSTNKPAAALLVVAAIAAIAGALFLWGRYQPNPRKVATWLDLPDRILFAHVVKAPWEVKSFIREILGTYVHPVLIATDRRVLLARPTSERLVNGAEQQFELSWESVYAGISSVSSKSTGGEHPEQTVTMLTRGRALEYVMKTDDSMAFIAILERYMPPNGVVRPAT